MPRNKKSVVWDYFIKILDDPMNNGVQCQLCNRKMKFFGNTTNLKEHLRRTHPHHLASNDSLNSDGFILFVDEPKVKRAKKIKEDISDDPEDTNADHESLELSQPDASITIKENVYGDKDNSYTVSISRREHHQDNIEHLGTDDFARIVESDSFVDKSLMIEDIFKHTYMLITAPHGFGKSTNLNMIKRFLEITVGEDGFQKDIRTTNNFRIFRDGKLLITENLKFCRDHMGQHPIIDIDFASLSIIHNFDDMIQKLKMVMRRTFLQHTYLLKSGGLLVKSTQEVFQKFCDPFQSLTLNVDQVITGFIFLSEILFLHFKKRVTVLIDNYDAYVDSLLFKNNPDTEQIINCIQRITKDLLKCNSYVDHAVLTGVFPVTSSGVFTATLNVKNFYFLDNHIFCKYFGITSDELTDLLKKYIHESHEREKTERIIAEYYGGYIVPSQNLSMCNLWSILNYLDNKRMPLNYWCQPEHYDFFKLIFSTKEVGEEIQQLLLGVSRCTDLSKPLSKINFSTFNNVLNGTDSWSNAINIFLKLLYHLGYLTANENLTFDQSEVFLRIPNSEIRLEFARIMKDTYLQKYSFKDRFIRNLHSATNAFNIQSYDCSKFELFCKSLNDLFSNSTYYPCPKNSNDFQCILFTLLASKFCITQSEIYKTNMKGSIDILAVNDSGVGIFIETRILKKERMESEEQVAIKAHKQILNKKCCEYFDRNFEATMGKICIGICINENNISLAYSYSFNIEDDIESVSFISV